MCQWSSTRARTLAPEEQHAHVRMPMPPKGPPPAPVHSPLLPAAPLAILKYLRFGESYFAFGRPDACGAVGKQKASCSQTKGVIIMQQEA